MKENHVKDGLAIERMFDMLEEAGRSYIPWFIDDQNGDERAVLVNAVHYRRMAEDAEEFSYVKNSPGYQHIEGQLKKAQASRKALAEEMDKIVGRAAGVVCPRCRPVLEKMMGTSGRTAAWRRIRGSGEGGISVGVAGVGD